MKVIYGAIVQRASGRFGGTVHSNWKGVDVVRRFAKPSNPNSAGQQTVRTAFKQLTALYGVLPSFVKAAWVSYATGKPIIARNKLIALNVPALNGQTDYSSFVPTPGDSSTLPPVAFVPTGGNDQITTVITPPSIPSGWTIANCIACCISAAADPSSDPFDVEDLRIVNSDDASSPFTPTLSGLTAGDYYTWAFIQWNAPDGTTRYSASLAGGSVTVT